MELHTLGADGGYTQDDVITLARILTGWGINRPDARAFPNMPRSSRARVTITAPRCFSVTRCESRGKAEGEEALDILARSPATARHIAFELAQYFVADEPPPALVERLAARFLETDGNIREVLKTLFASREFRDSYGPEIQDALPIRDLGGARRRRRRSRNVRPLLGTMDQLGMPLFGCLTPDGYKNTEDAWLSPDATTRRISFATALAAARLPVSDRGRRPCRRDARSAREQFSARP